MLKRGPSLALALLLVSGCGRDVAPTASAQRDVQPAQPETAAQTETVAARVAEHVGTPDPAPVLARAPQIEEPRLPRYRPDDRIALAEMSADSVLVTSPLREEESLVAEPAAPAPAEEPAGAAMVMESALAIPTEPPRLSSFGVSPLTWKISLWTYPLRDLIYGRGCDCTNLQCRQPIEQCGQLWPPTHDDLGQSRIFGPPLADVESGFFLPIEHRSELESPSFDLVEFVLSGDAGRWAELLNSGPAIH